MGKMCLAHINKTMHSFTHFYSKEKREISERFTLG